MSKPKEIESTKVSVAIMDIMKQFHDITIEQLITKASRKLGVRKQRLFKYMQDNKQYFSNVLFYLNCEYKDGRVRRK